MATALITGASSGLGKEFAIIYASMGYDLVLVARSEDKLKKIKKVLENRCNIKVHILVEDLSDISSAKRIYDRTKELGITVDRLINNAGRGVMKTISQCDEDTLVSIINLNITSLTLLSHYFSNEMVSRGSGKILQVSSLGAFQPDPFFNVYGPSKAYELFLGATMYGELKNTGVTVSVLCPGPVKTNWASQAGKKDSKLAKSPRKIAIEGVKGLEKGELVIVPTMTYKVERVLVSILPKKAVASIIAKWQLQLGKQ